MGCEVVKTNFKKAVVCELKQILKNAVNKSDFVGVSSNQIAEWFDSFVIEVPAEELHGDFATNIAMVGAKILKLAPSVIAKKLLDNVSLDGSSFKSFEFVMPGFINFFLNVDWFYMVLNGVLLKGDGFGKSNLGQGKRVLVEYVSANPTGPMHVGNARGGAIGDCLAEILSWVGFDVQKEFYLNDAGNQIEKFKKSLSLRYVNLFDQNKNFKMPEDSYHGDDIIELAREFAKIYGDKFIYCDETTRQNALVEFALPSNVDAIKSDLKSYRINYDSWFSEKKLYENGKVLEIVEKLKKLGQTYMKDGAVWFNFSSCGGEKDEVLVRDNGLPTYFAADVAYHYNKFITRKFDLALDVWGADHHGHVARLKGALKVLGVDITKLKVVLMQLVRLVKNGKTVKLSKRSGKAITLHFLLDRVGVDAARFFFNLREANSHFDFDLDLAVEQSNNNPVFYVQYAYARICQLLNKIDSVNFNLDDFLNKKIKLNYEFVQIERVLIKLLVEFECKVQEAANSLNSSLIAKFTLELAAKFHKFYSSVRILGESNDCGFARIVLCKALKQVFFNAFSILKIEAKNKL